MTKSQLIERIALHHPEIHSDDVGMAINALVTGMANALAAGDRIELRGFGAFRTKSRNPRIGRNPATGTPVHISRRHVVHFKPGKELRERANGTVTRE